MTRCRTAFAMHLDRVALLVAGLWVSTLLWTQAALGQDTIQVLDEIEVVGQRTPSTLATIAPTQVLKAEQLEVQGALMLSDAVRQMAGVTLKDYGGVGGMKTVSARGLGSQFSTVTIDGIAINDAQNGQVDLSRYLLGNAAYVSLQHGTEQHSLLTARAYAAGNVLNLETAEPQFFHLQRTNLRVGVEAGSFGMLSPTALWEQRWSRRLRTSVWLNYLKSDGDYPFTLYYTADHQGQRSTERRQHSAMHMATADANLFYTISPSSRLTAKAHYMNGHHQLPGPVQFYTQRVGAEQTAEEVAFGQIKWQAEKGDWRWQTVGKLQSLLDTWEDSAANTPSHYQMNRYQQREAYLSGTARRMMGAHWHFDLATDAALSHLLNNKSHCNDVYRTMLTGVAALHYRRQHLAAEGHLVGATTADHIAELPSAPAFRRLTPYLGLSYTMGERTTWRLFYKETFRTPNFGELYFFPEDTLPHQLRPERAHQLNLGLTHIQQWATASATGTVDVYFNRVSDKIIAVPGRSMFLWTMINEGQVDITGIDAHAELATERLEVQINYGFAHAVVRTDPTDLKTYGAQIPYTPRHSGSISAHWSRGAFGIGATALLVGHRYSDSQNSAEAYLPPYCDLGISADYTPATPIGTMRLQLQVLNLLGTQYEVVRAYPMMGRSVRISLTYIL